MSLKLNERYPARFNNPTAGYPQGSFKNRTTPTAKDGSYLEKDWANDKEGFFQSLLSAAGITANGAVDAVGASQFFDALQALKQIQAGTAFTTAGIAGVLTLAPTPAIPAYSAPLRFHVKFSQDSTGNDTINVSGKGAQSLKQYNSAGAKVAAVFTANQLADIEYDGVDFVLLDQLPGTTATIGIQGSFKNLSVSTTGLSSVVKVTADELMVESSLFLYQTLRAVNVSPSFAIAGAGGLDVGAANSQTAPTWYSVWVIWNGTTVSSLLSLSASSPTMPSGYTHKARVAWVRTDASGNKYPLGFMQTGRRARYRIQAGTNVTSVPLMINGAQGNPLGNTPTYIPVAVAAFVPPTATVICLTLSAYVANSSAIAAPNTSYQGISSTNSVAAPLSVSLQATAPTHMAATGDFVIESANVYYASTGVPAGLSCNGWEDVL
ncbi:hypothetical protein [Pseudomonas extremaustralis]|uniref:Uncharacterized protein n=1 Tax=Pseudomonas extremaustralis TaxID=359110 RepID=A0A5C5Q1X8_9PSED|nr:hypothetical protein [Pseudomonas extremaustralis]TWR98375.1 hypothetical protein FIV36_29705 [Pseudomonas extremaustralis]SDE71022.1 hypothetical protein SAMN05216591_0696 [Pseudomonas extremaustralis]